jgi:hypothetical protein
MPASCWAETHWIKRICYTKIAKLVFGCYYSTCGSYVTCGCSDVSFYHSKGLRCGVTKTTHRVENTSVPKRRLSENLVLNSSFQNVHKPNIYWRYIYFHTISFPKICGGFWLKLQRVLQKKLILISTHGACQPWVLFNWFLHEWVRGSVTKCFKTIEASEMLSSELTLYLLPWRIWW